MREPVCPSKADGELKHWINKIREPGAIDIAMGVIAAKALEEQRKARELRRIAGVEDGVLEATAD